MINEKKTQKIFFTQHIHQKTLRVEGTSRKLRAEDQKFVCLPGAFRQKNITGFKIFKFSIEFANSNLKLYFQIHFSTR